MGDIFIKLLNMSITAGWLILIVICVRLLFRRMPKWINCLLWGVVAIRLICPFSIESVLSLQPSAEPVKVDTMVEGEILPYVPSIDSNFTIVEDMVNPILAETFSYQQSESLAPLQVFTEVAGYIWLCGVIILFAFAVGSVVRLRLNVREAVRYKDNIFICDTVKAPFILGIFRPGIYLPSSLNEREINHILAHETGHLRRKDYLWKPLGYLLLSVYWFNPICWIAYIMLCKDIELACDEKVIRDMNFSDKQEYSRILLSCTTGRRLVLACPLAFGEVGVKERVKNVLTYKRPAFWIIVIGMVLCVAVAVFFLTDPAEKDELPVISEENQEGSNSTEEPQATVTESDGAEESEESAVSEESTEPVFIDDSLPRRYDYGDPDGNGVTEYAVITQMGSQPGYDGHLAFYFNDECVYDKDQPLRVSPGGSRYIDLDGDGGKELFFTMNPHVNSMPLMTYVVLKHTEDGWKELNIPQGADELDNAFPISVRYGNSKNKVEITCEGLEEAIVLDVTEHYEKFIEKFKDSGIPANQWEAILAGMNPEGGSYSAGDSFGSVAAWGIWDIDTAMYDGKLCLKALHGIQGPYGKDDMLGGLSVCFDFDKEGNVHVLGMEFEQWPY
ncbi:MAG: hypothetical protein IKL04_09945 [Lachnospiraceae bacterium]|nr:hypothetical protein [Lachnospiraceae bacterium]